jgi:hypothetical protein
MAFCVSMAICSHLHRSLKKLHSSNYGTFPCVSHLLCWSSSCQCHYPSTPLCLTYQKKRVFSRGPISKRKQNSCETRRTTTIFTLLCGVTRVRPFISPCQPVKRARQARFRATVLSRWGLPCGNCNRGIITVADRMFETLGS